MNILLNIAVLLAMMWGAFCIVTLVDIFNPAPVNAFIDSDLAASLYHAFN